MEEPTVISVFIKSDRLRTRVPQVGEMVRMVDRQGLFVVTRVDRQRQLADLMYKAGQQELEESVPFSSIRALDKHVSRAVQEFLNSSLPAEDEENSVPPEDEEKKSVA